MPCPQEYAWLEQRSPLCSDALPWQQGAAPTERSCQRRKMAEPVQPPLQEEPEVSNCLSLQLGGVYSPQ